MRTIKTAVIAACLLAASLAQSAFAQATLSPVPMIQFFDASSGVGLPCVGCTLSTFVAGTSTPVKTYVDNSGTTQNPFVITLSSLGMTTSGVWLGSSCYKFILANASASVIWTQDNVCGSLAAAGSPSFSALTVTGNAAVGGTLTVTGTASLGVVTAAGITTTAVTGYAISPIFNGNIAGLSGSCPGGSCPKTFQNSDGSYSVDYKGNILAQHFASVPVGNTTAMVIGMSGTVGHAASFSQTTSAGTATVVIANTGTDPALELGLVKFDATNTTGATATLWGSNCPAVTCTAPYTWITTLAADGSTVYIPVFK
jgi:hypothetical protein